MAQLKQKRQLDIDSPEVAQAGFKAVNNILTNWGCTQQDKSAITQIARSSFFRFQSDPEKIRLSRDQLTRLSYILNIHKALRIIFDNPENITGFMSKKNHNAFFEGRAPLDVIREGDFGALYEVTQRIDSLRAGRG